MTYGVKDLERVLDKVPPNSRGFAADLIRKAPRGLSDKQMFWVNKLAAAALNPVQLPLPIAVGNLAGIIALFDRARQHLKFPAIVLSCPEAETLRVNVAGPSAKFPGSLNVTSYERIDNLGDRRRWYGRVQRNGSFEPGPKAGSDIGPIADRLRAFAADPVGIAAEHGRLTGRCCFCNQGLKDERSTSVGYGPICAEHYGLPWGS